MKIISISGSPRPKGNTNYLASVALDEASRMGAQTENIILSQHKINPCVGHVECASFPACKHKDDMAWILDKFCEADGVILTTPVYWYNVTAQMKTFIDRNYFLYKKNIRSKAKIVGFIVIGEVEGIEDTLHTLNQFADWQFSVDKSKRFTVTGYALKPGEVKEQAALVENAKQLGRRMVEVINSSTSA